MVRLASLGGLLLSVLFVALAVHGGYFGTGVLAVYLVLDLPAPGSSWLAARSVSTPARSELPHPGGCAPDRRPRRPPARARALLRLLSAALPARRVHHRLHVIRAAGLLQIQWFVGYPEKGTWVSQFPILFHALQKPFFMLLGPTVDAVRISTWPYLALTVVYLYLLARETLAGSGLRLRRGRSAGSSSRRPLPGEPRRPLPQLDALPDRQRLLPGQAASARARGRRPALRPVRRPCLPDLHRRPTSRCRYSLGFVALECAGPPLDAADPALPARRSRSSRW